MGNSKRKPNGRPRAQAARRRTLGHPGVWLATLSTVVGVATGMFTLRDQIFPSESGSAQASLQGYQAAVGKVCDDVNDTDAARAENSRLLRGRLRRAHTMLARRDLLLDGVNIVLAGSGDGLAKLSGREPPAALARRHRETVAAWNHNLELVRRYQQALDAAATPGQLAAAIGILARSRLALSRGGVTVRRGLVALGGDQCDLQRPTVTKTVSLPGISPHDLTPQRPAAPSRRRAHRRVAGPANRPSPATPAPNPPGTVTPTPQSSAAAVNPPSTVTPAPQPSAPAINPPSTSGGGAVGGGGGD